MKGEDPFPHPELAIAFFRQLFFNNADACLLRQPPGRGGEIHVLILHDELKNAAPRSAAEAFEDLPLGIDREGGGALVVKRAERLIDGSRALEGEMSTDDLHDIAGRGDLFDEFWCKAAHVHIANRGGTGWQAAGPQRCAFHGF
ncbi:MAG: hypothetical protein QM796_13920 [Chthoniobacteraceae bacterium]